MFRHLFYTRLKQSWNDCSPGRTATVRLRGFTLIEVTISILVIGAMLIASTALLHGVSASALTRDEAIALSIAQNEIESLRAEGYAALPASGSFSDTSLASLTSGVGSTTISTYDAKTKRVDVSVLWQEKDASSHTITLTTLITQTGGLR